MKKRSLLATLLAALLVLVVFTGCAASSKMAAADTASAPNGYYDSKQEAAAAETPMEAPAEPEEEFAYDTVATTEAGSGAAETPEPDDSVADYTAKIIYTASVSIETTEFDKAVAALESQVQKIGGFVESSNVTGDTQYNADGTTSIVNRWAYYTVRIPCEQFEAFLHETEGFGNVISTSRDAQNVLAEDIFALVLPARADGVEIRLLTGDGKIAAQAVRRVKNALRRAVIALQSQKQIHQGCLMTARAKRAADARAA